MTGLPPPRTPGRYRVGIVCLGNICRSPMADVVLSQRVAAAGLEERVEVASCGTAGWHTGKPMDPRAAAILTTSGYDANRHRAQQLASSWFDAYDVLLAMDAQNRADVLDLDDGTDADRVLMFRDLDPVEPGGEVPDPYYGGDEGFEEVLAMVERTSDAIVDALRRLLEHTDAATGRP